ncbi:DUF1819 family protein [Cerasibacillus terrae]|uniref:DUF1819 family protein n=2 Tax=Cerasibacillus terrae TaxID=2498845 RepID=A0A5C8NS01_9BACI|nr:DUF1819 family protein [Cerasibacillus terrae]
MMYEMRQVCKLKLQGMTDEEVRKKVFEENIFQYNKMSSLKRSFPYLLKRVNSLDDTLMTMMVDEPIEVGKVINLYSIMKTDCLFFDFMNEVVKEPLQNNKTILEKKDVNVFFVEKEEQSEFIANLADSTKARLKSAFMKVLLEVGMIKDLKSRELRHLLMDGDVKNHLIQIGDIQYVQAMGE